MLIEGIAGTFAQRQAGLVAIAPTKNGSLRVAQLEGEGDEATRAGLRYHLAALAAAGQAPIQALPTTTAAWLLFNPTANIMTAMIDVVGMVNVSGTAGSGANLYGCIVAPANVPTTLPTMVASANIVNANPISARTSKLVLATAVTLVGTAGLWFPMGLGVAKDGVVAVPPVLTGMVESRDIRGKHIIPPGCGLALVVVAPTGTTPLYCPYGSWREYAADNE